MSKYKSMGYEETIEELQFAISHGIDFTKHGFNMLLNRDAVEMIVRQLGIVAEYKAWIIEGNRAYYSLSFRDTKSERNLGKYFSKDVISQHDSYTIDSVDFIE
jgi:hypothetical protein